MRKTKILSLVLALALTVSMLAGCGGETNVNVAENEEVLNLEGALASKEPLTLTAHIHFWDTNIFEDDWYWNVEAAKVTNITLRGTASKTAADSKAEFNTMLVNDVLPDIIHGDGVDLNDAGRDGALIPLQDLVKKYAPNIQAAFDKYPDAYNSVVDTNGNLYYIPYIYNQEGPTMGWFVRQDWLDKLGLEAPTTVEEYYNVLKAFREQDPNGNGIKDEIPYFDRHKSPKNLLGLFGVTKEYYLADENGQYYASFMTEEYKNAMREIAKWYAEGLIDPEIYSRGGTSREQLFGGNVGGALHDWFSSSFAYNSSMKASVPDFKLITIAPPADINGNVINWSPRTELNGNGWGISKDNKHVAETMKFFNFWFTEDGVNLHYYGIEGIDHVRTADGGYEFSETAKAYEAGVPAYQGTFGSREIGIPVLQESEVKGMSEDAAEGFAWYVEQQFTVPAYPVLTYTTEENKIITNEGAAVDTLLNEYAQHWVLGNKDIDATWDQYISELKSMGVEKVVETHQAAYNRYIGK